MERSGCNVEPILVAVDFGDASAKAIAAAAAIAERCGASGLTLLHAESIEAPAYFTPAQIERLAAERAVRRAQAEEYLKAFGGEHAGVRLRSVVIDRAPADAILQEGAAAGLIAMGTHGRRGPSRWWLGSVAERVLRETTTPLLIVHADWTGDPRQLFARTVLQTTAAAGANAASGWADILADRFRGSVLRERPPLPLATAGVLDATAVVAAVPTPVTAAWLAAHGEPLLQSCRLPVLFVRADNEGERK